MSLPCQGSHGGDDAVLGGQADAGHAPQNGLTQLFEPFRDASFQASLQGIGALTWRPASMDTRGLLGQRGQS